jgi:hypothetical protein
MPSPDHMAGINALPKWDPANLDKGYSYDPKNYSSKDYNLYKVARTTRDQQRVAKDQRDFQQAMKSAAKVVREKVSSLRGQNRDLEWDGDSTVFADLYYDAEAGGVWASFFRGGQLEYFYDMDRETAREFLTADSAGEFFNSFIRD